MRYTGGVRQTLFVGCILQIAHFREPGHRLKKERSPGPWPRSGFQSWTSLSEGSWGRIELGPVCGQRGVRSKRDDQLSQRGKHLGK